MITYRQQRLCDSLMLLLFLILVLRFFFFFQAEDGIRDHCVTGVQTCALPISPMKRLSGFLKAIPAPRHLFSRKTTLQESLHAMRSEERRVGKECRSRWSP